ncbi:MAG: LPS biosynthesis protein RfbU [Thermodesulfobacteriota bacterium]|nr:MAG: LPS biosynthesis protein RfbU [Thermodesulfobacteriota bacterium]
MRVLTVIPSYWPAFEFGGPIYCIHDLNKTLAEKGVDIHVYTTNVGLNGQVTPNSETDVDGVKVTYFKFSSLFEGLGKTGWQFSLPLTKALKKDIKSFDLIYIVSVWNYPVAAASYYSRKFNVPYVISPVGSLYSETMLHKSWKKLPYLTLVAKRDLKAASAIHYTTDDEASKCHSALSLQNESFIVPNGLFLSEYADLPPADNIKKHFPHLEGKRVILFLGRLNWKKGLDILISAFKELKEKIDDVHLLLVGNDEASYAAEVKQMITQCGLKYIDVGLDNTGLENLSSEEIKQADITFTGMLTDRSKLEAFTGSEVFVLSSYSENFGMSVIESMACGTPVIITNNVGIYKEVQKNHAGIVIENGVDNLLASLSSLLDHDSLREEISQNGKKLVNEYYNISDVADRMIQSFDLLIKNHRQ